MEQEFKILLELNHKARIKDFAQVRTYSSYINQESGTEETLFIKRNISADNTIIALVGKSGKADYVINSDFNTLCYLSFYLNSIWGKVSILPKQKFNEGQGKTNALILKNTEVIRNPELEPYCILVERIITFLTVYSKKYGTNVDNHSDTIKRFFENLRNFIVMELMIPKLFENNDVSVIYPWINEVNSITNPEDIGESITQIFTSLFKSGNPLMENMNRMRLFITQFTQYMSERNG